MAAQRKGVGEFRAEPQGPLGKLLLERVDALHLSYPRLAKRLNARIKNETGEAAGVTISSIRNWVSRWTIPSTDTQRALMLELGIPDRTFAEAVEAQLVARPKHRAPQAPQSHAATPLQDVSLAPAEPQPISSGHEVVPHVGAAPDGEFVSIPVQTANGVIAYVITRRTLLTTLATAMPGLAMPHYTAEAVAPVATRLTDIAELLTPTTAMSAARPVERGSFLTVTRLLASQRQAVAPEALLSLVEAHRDSLAMLFRRATTDPVRADIGALLGETSIVASRLWSAMGNRPLAIANCAFARQLADRLDNPVLGALARIFESNLQSEAATLIGAEGDVVLGLRMLTEAASAEHLLSPAARARIAAEQAQAYAVLNLGRESQHALDRARRAVEAIDDGDRTGLFSDWTPSRLLVYEGTCWLLLGEAKKAVATLNRALRAAEADRENVNVLLAARVDLAIAYAENGELQEGCRLLAETHIRLIDMGNHRGIQRARRARERLNAWKDEPAVRDLDEQLTGRDLQ